MDSPEGIRVKTELIIITILHIIIITTSILILDFKTFAPKILAHKTCINRYWKYTQISAVKSKQKLIAKSDKTHCKNWAELTAKIIKYWRLPKIIIYTKYSLSIKIFAPMKYSRPWNIRAHEIFAPMKCLRPWNIRAHEIFAPMKYLRLLKISASMKCLRPWHLRLSKISAHI